MPQLYVMETDETTKRTAERWNEMRKREELVDFTLYNGFGDEVKGHMLIMALSSPTIKNMIYSYSNIGRFLLIHISADAMEQLMNFMYIGEIEISRSNAHHIFIGAMLLRLSIVERVCSSFITVNQCFNTNYSAPLQYFRSIG